MTSITKKVNLTNILKKITRVFIVNNRLLIDYSDVHAIDDK